MSVRDVFLGNWLRKLTSLAAAVVLFHYVGDQRTGERTLAVPLAVRGQAEYLVAAQRLPETVPVRVAGPARALARLEARRLTAVVDLSGAVRGPNAFPVQVLFPDAGDETRFSAHAQPLRAEMDLLRQRTVQYRVRLVGRPAPGYRVAEAVVTPAGGLVTGAASVLDRLAALDLEPVDVGGAMADLVVERRVASSPWNLGLARGERIEVRVRIVAEAVLLVERVPVRAWNLGRGLRLADPAALAAAVLLRGRPEALAGAVAERIDARVDLGGVTAPGTYRLRVEVRSNPAWDVARVEPAVLNLVIVKEQP